MTVKEYNNTVESNADQVYRFILKNIKNEAKAQDIVQDSFERLWMKRSELKYEKAKPYLFAMAYRVMIDVIRKDKRMFLTNDREMFESFHQDSYSDANEVMEKAVFNMPYELRSVILLRDFEGYSYEEIAKIADMSEAQVKINIYRARVLLKNYIGKIENVL